MATNLAGPAAVRTVVLAGPIAVGSAVVYTSDPPSAKVPRPQPVIQDQILSALGVPAQLPMELEPATLETTVPRAPASSKKKKKTAKPKKTAVAAAPVFAGVSTGLSNAASTPAPFNRALFSSSGANARANSGNPLEALLRGKTPASTVGGGIIEAVEADANSSETDSEGGSSDSESSGSSSSAASSVSVTLTLDSSPATLTNQSNATFSFTISPSSILTKCALDGAAETDCTSPVTYNALADGAHSLVITPYVGGSAQTSLSVTHNWTISTVVPNAPAATLNSSTPTNSTAATITIADCTERSHILVNEGAQPSSGAAGWQTCSTGAGAITYTMSGDGAHTLKVWAKNTAGSVSATSTDLAVTLDQTAPMVSLTSHTGGQAFKSASTQTITWTASDATAGFGATPITLEYSTNSGTSWTVIANNEANDGTYGWTVPAGENANVRVRVTAVDTAGNSASSASSSDLIIDNTAPALTAGQMSVNSGAATTTSSYVQVSLAASDTLSNITHFCLRYNNTTAPNLSDTCWTGVDENPPNLTPATTLTLTNYSYPLGLVAGNYTVYAWVRDLAGNISALTNAGAGTNAQDRDAILYQPGTPPTLTDILVANSTTPSNPPTSGDLTLVAGSHVYIKWNASDDAALPASPIALYYTTDDSTYTLIANNLANGSNGGCVINDAGTTADDNATGCYIWSSGSPTNNYYRIRVTATDANSMVSYSQSTALNTWPPINFLAGNTEVGLGGSATAAMFFGNTSGNTVTDHGSLVVSSNGTMYFRDIYRGIMKISPTDGVQTLYIPTTGSSTGDTGPATSATLRYAAKIGIDYNDRLMIFDYDRIRRVESDGTIDTIIGGGADTADTAAPLDVQFETISNYSTRTARMPLFALPNGDIYFQSENYTDATAIRLRVLDVSSNIINSINPSGVGDSFNASQDINVGCTKFNFGTRFDPATSIIQYFTLTVRHHTSFVGCTGSYYASSKLNTDGTVSPGPHPNNGSSDLSTKFSGMDGKLYAVDRNGSVVMRLDDATTTWVTLAGTGLAGSCTDGTAATSCNIDVSDAFVTRAGRVYFVDRGRIRLIDDSGNVQTVAGQGFAFGDGGHALSARFGVINDFELWNDAGADKVIVLDQSEARFREFVIGGNINTIAGNSVDGNGQLGVAATATPVQIGSSGQIWDQFEIDTSGNVYYRRTPQHLSKLTRSTGQWTDLVGNGATNYYDAGADGALGSAIALPSYPHLLIGITGTTLLGAKGIWNGSAHAEAMMKLWSTTDGTQTHLAGVTGASGSVFCADGTALSSCAVPRAYGRQYMDATYDSFSPRWVVGRKNHNQLYTMVVGGNIATLATIPRNAVAFAYRHDATNDILYYCAVDGRMYKYNVATSTETALAWPISSMSCTERSMTYSSSRNSVLFIYTQNNMYGIAEYVNP